MAETISISTMAAKVSDEILEVFGWKSVGPRDQNFSCLREHKGSTGKQVDTHPTDVVFGYPDPYDPVHVTILTDLKSYKKSSISKGAVAGALRVLAQSVQCAAISEEWQERHCVDGSDSQRFVGLLFIFNHDSEYDADFQELLDKVKTKNLALSASERLYVLGPRRVAYLATVANDIMRLRGQGKLPDATSCWFGHPDLVGKACRSSRSTALRFEDLTGPIFVLRNQRVEANSVRQGAIVYFDGQGTKDEFKYLIGYLLRWQILHNCQEVQLRLGQAARGARSKFEVALEEFIKNDMQDLPEARQRLEQISMETITNVIRQFCSEEISMVDRTTFKS